MSEFSIENQSRRPGRPAPSRHEILTNFRIATKPRYTLLDHIAPPPPPPPSRTASPHEMVNPTHAWRRLLAATHCDISRGAFYRWIRTGRLYTVRLGGRIFVPLSALETLIENCLRGESL